MIHGFCYTIGRSNYIGGFGVRESLASLLGYEPNMNRYTACNSKDHNLGHTYAKQGESEAQTIDRLEQMLAYEGVHENWVHGGKIVKRG